MAEKLAKYKEEQRQQWGRAAEYWARWHDQVSEMSREATRAIVAAADLAEGQRVLDLAGGTGEPALTLAEAVGPGGSVVASDLTPEMVAVLEENVRKRGLANVECRQIDAESIPFPDESFDRVTCRFGVMFFPDIPRALAEVRRVLKPEGRVAFVAWAPAELNPFFSKPNGVLRRHGLLNPPPPDAPNVFRFAQAGSLSAAMKVAGLREVSEDQRRIGWRWPGDLDSFWSWFGQGPIFRGAIEAAEPERRQAVIDEVRAALAEFADGDGLAFGGTIVLASGVR